MGSSSDTGKKRLLKRTVKGAGMPAVKPGVTHLVAFAVKNLIDTRLEYYNRVRKGADLDARQEAANACADAEGTLAEALDYLIAPAGVAAGRCPRQVDGGRCAGLAGHQGDCYANARDRKGR